MGLFDTNLSPDAVQAIGLLGVGLQRGDFAGGATNAMGLLAGAEDRKIKRNLLEMQAENYRSEIEQRKAAIQKQQRIQEAVAGLLGGSTPAPAQPGQMGSGSFGLLSPPAGQTDMPQPRGGLSGASLEQVAGLHALGGPNLMDAYKFAREGIERKPGSFYEDMQGRRDFIPDVKTGMDYRGGRINEIPGYSDFLTRQTLAQKGPEALIGSAARVNLRDNPDGTKRAVSELDENTTLQRLLSGYMPGGMAAAPAAPAPRPMAGGARPVIAPADQKSADAESIGMIQAELQNPRLPPDQRAGLQRELSRLTASQSQPGFPTPTMARPTPAQGYGKTTAQETADAVEKERQLGQVKADVMPTQQRRAALDSANYMYNLLDTAIKHPGRETATGMSGTFDPRNYLPGTNATNFKVMLDQIKGSAFMQAFQSLKGGGQITEVEGKKATDAIARLNTAQSDEEFKSALSDFQDVIATGIRRMGGTVSAGREASGKIGPTAGTVENGYRFVGGNPADRNSWVKQ